MKYRYSQTDKSNAAWFLSDNSRSTLREIELAEGQIRGLHPCTINFDYPITAIAGKNGSGKSTILALAACAFHNEPEGFRLPDRSLPYYRYSDFFVQTDEEVLPEGITIYYGVMYDNWKPSAESPATEGLAFQTRRKKKAGKWTDYDLRVNRPVVFFGIDRVVPPSEKSSFRSARYKFSDVSLSQIQDASRTAVARVLEQSYDNFKLLSHGKYRLPLVSAAGNTYSGFNMGAGEKALFEIFTAIYSAPFGTLFVIDEIELGLYEAAQANLISLLKEICLARKIQVICTTHSQSILRSLPPAARVFVEKQNSKTHILTGITPEYATGLLAGRPSGEIDVYVEDRFASKLLTAFLPRELRARTSVIPIGSPESIADQLAARYRHQSGAEVLAVLDGDQSPNFKSFLNRAEKSFSHPETREKVRAWIAERIAYLPGNVAPESHVLATVFTLELGTLSAEFGCANEAELKQVLAEVMVLPDPHDVFPALAEKLHVGTLEVELAFCRTSANAIPEEFQQIYERVQQLLA